jgi:uncharacterized protein (DUF2141 family)
MNLRKQLHWFIYPLFFLACARQTTPTGGPKDTIPPRLIKSIPAKEEVNYKRKSVELTFSEMIALNSAKEQILITPDVGKDYEVAMKNDRVIISFKNPLKDSTTYLMNFRDAVQDITEKNSVKNLKLAFSTGSYIDSLTLEGAITDHLKGTQTKDATVALFSQDTFNIFKHKPMYFTKSDDKGIYRIENLKPGRYFIYAIDDKNKNLIVDSRNESFGFLSDTIHLKENIKKVDLSTVRLDARPLKITSARPYNTYFNIKTTKGMESFHVNSNTKEEIIISSFGEDKSNIRVYNTFENVDSVSVNFHANDSLQNAIDTTFFVKFIKRDVEAEKFDMKTEELNMLGTKGTISGKVRFNKPLLTINFDSLYYIIDSAKHINFTQQDVSFDSLNNVLSFNKNFDKKLLEKAEDKPNEISNDSIKQETAPEKPQRITGKSNPKQPKKKQITNQLYMGNATFISIELDSSKNFTQPLRPKNLEDLGIIFIEVQTKEPHFLVQILDKNFNIVKSVKDNKKFSFEDLDAGDYQLRLVIDRNNDGKWNAGNFFNREEPEPIKFYRNEKKTTTVNLKANWEVGPLLITY